MVKHFWICVSAAILLITAAAHAAEEITAYESDITVRADGSLLIREVITVRAEGRDIRRGIFRDFPTDYRDNQGNRIRAGFEVQSVSRNGEAEPYQVSPHANGMRVRIGSADTLLTRDEHRYEITYETSWQVTHLPETDELYFNAVGQGWRFPILAAEVTVTLPDGAVIGRATGYAGEAGRSDWTVAPERLSDSSLRYRLDKPLDRYEGLTVVLEWQPGLVTRPTQTDQAFRFLEENGWALVGGIGVFVVFFYLYGAWRQVGKDPDAGPVVALYEAPDGPHGPMSPALSRFIHKMRSDHTGFTAALVSLASKGFLTIEQVGKTVTVHRVGTVRGLPPGEKVIAAHLLPRVGDSHTFEKKYDKTLAKIVEKFAFAVGRGEAKYFKFNLSQTFTGAALFVAMLLSMLVASASFIWGLMASLLIALVGYAGLGVLKDPDNRKGQGLVLVVALLLAISQLVLVVMAQDFLGPLAPAVGMLPFAIIGLMVLLVFSVIMASRTPYGQVLANKVEGLKLYMSVAEKDRLDFHNPPERTTEHFEALLPYAIALGVENRWGDQFDDILQQAAQTRGEDHYHPSWYIGSNYGSSWGRGFSTGAFAGAVASGVTSSIASAATPPSSSGSSGFSGGSSGGGGGGGGGGGW